MCICWLPKNRSPNSKQHLSAQKANMTSPLFLFSISLIFIQLETVVFSPMRNSENLKVNQLCAKPVNLSTCLKRNNEDSKIYLCQYFKHYKNLCLVLPILAKIFH